METRRRIFRLVPATAALAAILSGCAALAVDECTADSYQVGERDGRMAAFSQAEIYAARCDTRGQFDAARYTEGWRAGFAARPRPLW